jgi:hypothetical protein
VLETYFTDSVQGGSQGFYTIDPSKPAVLGERFLDGVFDDAARLTVIVDRPRSGTLQEFLALIDLHPDSITGPPIHLELESAEFVGRRLALLALDKNQSASFSLRTCESPLPIPFHS